MIDIFIKDNNSVVINNKTKHLILQHSSSVDAFRVLVEKEYNSSDMSEFKCVMEYLLPLTKKYKMIELEEIQPESNSGGDYDEYADFVKYRIPINSEFTSESGAVEFQFTFAKKGDPENIIRKTTKTKITITPISEWSEVRMDVFNKELEEILDEIPSI